MSKRTPSDHPVDRFGALAPAMTRLGEPPRRLTTADLLSVLDSGGPGRPILRHGLLATLGVLLAAATLLPDVVFSSLPAFDLDVVGAEERQVPGVVRPVADLLPAALRGHVATFRMPSGEASTGPVSAAEYSAIVDGQETLSVHLGGDERSRGRPASGLFTPARLLIAGLLALVGVVFSVNALRRIGARWWIGRLARRGIETIGRINELKVKRLMRGEQPAGWQYTVYYDFRAGDGIIENAVQDVYSARHVPFATGHALRVLYAPDPPHASMPADLVTLRPRDD